LARCLRRLLTGHRPRMHSMDEQSIGMNLAAGAREPAYQTPGAAGADLCAFLDSPMTLAPGSRALIPTGLRLQLPSGFEAQVRSRSGLAARYGVACLNAPGTIDSDYRGEIKVILINHGTEDFVIAPGDRIAQLVVAPVCRARFELAPVLDASSRGEGGFGSTGV